jgi:hypothetical protein
VPLQGLNAKLTPRTPHSRPARTEEGEIELVQTSDDDELAEQAMPLLPTSSFVNTVLPVVLKVQVV